MTRRARLLGALVAALIVAVGTLVPAAPAAAHASLEASDPGDGAVVDEAPRTVTLRFSESVNVAADGVRVFDGGGRRVDQGDAGHGDGDSVATVGLERDLADGTYIVAWRVISADAHPIHGGYQFSIGAPSAVDQAAVDTAAGADDERPYEIAAGVARFLAYAGALLAAGGVLFRAWRHDPESWCGGLLVAIGAGVAIVGLLAQVPLQAALSTGDGLGSVTEDGVLQRVLDEGFGPALGISLAGVVLILAVAGRRCRGLPRLVGVVGAVLAAGGFAVTGHTRSMSPAVVAYVADFAHLLAAAVWFGGLVQLGFVVLRARRALTAAAGGAPDAAVPEGEASPAGARDAAVGVAQFSSLAGWSLAVIAVAGVVLGYIEVQSVHALTSTTYGRVLLVKVGVVAVVAGLAAWNRYGLVPLVAPEVGAVTGTASVRRSVLSPSTSRTATASPITRSSSAASPATPLGADGNIVTLDPDPLPGGDRPAGSGDIEGGDGSGPAAGGPAGEDERAWRTLRRVVRAEVLGLVVVLALTGALVNITPARESVRSTGVFNATEPLGDGTVNLIVDPARAGRNDLHLYLLDATGGSDDSAEGVTLDLALPSRQIGPITRTPVKIAPGHYQLLSSDFSLSGDWSVSVKARVTRFEEESTTITVPIGP